MTQPTPIRIRRSRAKGARLPENTTVVDRSTTWGNPFIVGTHGTAAECVDLYRMMLSGRLAVRETPTIAEQQAKLKHFTQHWRDLIGRNLACWCLLDKPCHADVLLRVVNQFACEAA